MKRYRQYSILLSMLYACSVLAGTQFKHHYTEQHPLIIVGDWDKPPYEYQNDRGRPVGMNIDVMDVIMEQLDIPYRYVLKEWSNALQTFENGEADLILANYRRYKTKDYAVSRNAVNYNRICVASSEENASDTVIPLSRLAEEDVVLKWGDYTSFFFHASDTASGHRGRVDYQSPKVALTGLADGDNKYFVWGEEPLKWKIKMLNLTGVALSEVSMPISEIHVIGRNHQLVEAIDDYYSRLKQSGELDRIQGRWLHPEAGPSRHIPLVAVAALCVLLLAVLFYAVHRLTMSRVRSAVSYASGLNDMMLKTLHTDNNLVVWYDIRQNRMSNDYGTLLPKDGMTLEEFLEHIYPDEQSDFNAVMSQLCNGQLKKKEVQLHWNTGTADDTRWMVIEGRAMQDADVGGRPGSVILSFRHAASEADDWLTLKDQAKKLDALFHIPVLTLSFYDSDGRLSDLNQSMKDLCGFESAENERFWRNTNMFDVPLLRSAYASDNHEDLFVCQRMEYADLHLSRFIELHVHPILDHEGSLIDYLVSAIDITDDRVRDRELSDREKAILATNEQIAVLEKRLNYILVNCKMYVWRLLLDSHTIQFSQSLRKVEFSISVEDYLKSMDEEHRQEAASTLNDPSRLSQPLALKHRFQDSPLAKESRWYTIVSVPTRSADGQLTGCFGLVRDITKLMDAQRRLREETARAQDSGRQKSMFLASMTHELRTPLNSIVGFSDLLRTVDSTEDRREFIRIIRKNCDMLLRLINDILEVSSLSDGLQSVSPVPVDFATSFDDVCQVLEQRVRMPGVEFLKDNPFDHYHTVLDMGRIQQVITNFVTNAVKYTEKGHIKVGYSQRVMTTRDGSQTSDGLYIYCEDTGAGIPREKQTSVFERFVKLNDFVQGTGLGLAICKSIADRCGGHIGVESEGPGHGSTFWLWIPCEREDK